METISADEAARILGVTRQTLYSYVSRRLIEPVSGSAQRASLYSKEAVEALQRSRRRGRRPKEIAKATLDFGLPVLESSLTLIERERLYYRGIDAIELARTRSLEEVACLLWQVSREDAFPSGTPTSNEMSWTAADLVEGFSVENLLTRFAVEAKDEPTAEWQQDPARQAQGCGHLVRLLTASALAASPSAADIHRQCAAAWKVNDDDADLVRQALVLCADHELNASSFTARCIASTGASLRAAVIGGLCALSGSRHGGATARVDVFWRTLSGSANIRAEVRNLLSTGMGVPGFGHPLYPSGDIRASAILERILPVLPEAAEIAKAVFDLTGRRPSLDFALVGLQRALKLPDGSAFAIFALGRSVGWIAQALEQRTVPTLIRPRAIYVGNRPQN